MSVKQQKFCTEAFLSICWVLEHAQPMKLYLQSLVDSHYRFTVGSRFCVTTTVIAIDNSRLVKLAMVDGCTLSVSESVTCCIQQLQTKVGIIM